MYNRKLVMIMVVVMMYAIGFSVPETEKGDERGVA